MELNFRDKVVAITGGTSGIGEEVALAYAREGALVAVCGRSREKLDAISKRFSAAGHRLLALPADVTKTAQLSAFAADVVSEYGRIDVWINNAGICIHLPFDELGEEDWYRVVDSNLKSVFFGSACAAAHMRKTGGGVIINTSSFTSILPTAGKAIYSATKAGVNTLTATLAIELAADRIRVVGIAPGYIATPLTEKNIEQNYQTLVNNIGLNRLGYSEDLVGAYLFLASEHAAYISGITLPVAGAKFSTQNPMWSWDRPAVFK